VGAESAQENLEDFARDGLLEDLPSMNPLIVGLFVWLLALAFLIGFVVGAGEQTKKSSQTAAGRRMSCEPDRNRQEQ
jgi:hypothetical protein